MDKERIEELVTMGFNKEDVVGALKKSNGDTNLAATYLMDGYQVSFDQQQVALSALPPTSAPPPPDYTQSVAISDMDNDIRDKITNTMMTSSAPIKEYNPIANKYNIYSDFPRTKKEDGLAVVLPSDPGLYESYLAPMVVILNNIPVLRNLLLKHQYFSYGFKSNWWNREKMFESNQLPMEYQRLLAILSDKSQRAFSSTYNLTMASNKLVTEDIEGGSEYLNFIFKSIVESFSKVNTDLEPELKKLLQFTLSTNIDDPLSNSAYHVIPIQGLVIKSDLYEDISSIFWGNNFENFNSLKLDSLSDIITLSIDTDGQSIEDGFNLIEEFYPQIYTKEHSYILGEKYEKINQLSTQYESNLQSIQDTKVFQGKKISSILKMAGDYIQGVGNSLGIESDGFGEGDKILAAGQTIQSVNNHITKYGKELQEVNETYPDRVSTLKTLLANPVEVITEHLELEPWVLTGVVLGPTEYFYKKSKDDEWVHVEIDKETCKDYRVETVDFQSVHNEVRNSTSIDFETLLILTYVRKSVWEKREIDELCESLTDFVTMDNASLQEKVMAYQGQSVIPQLE